MTSSISPATAIFSSLAVDCPATALTTSPTPTPLFAASSVSNFLTTVNPCFAKGRGRVARRRRSRRIHGRICPEARAASMAASTPVSSAHRIRRRGARERRQDRGLVCSQLPPPWRDDELPTSPSSSSAALHLECGPVRADIRGGARAKVGQVAVVAAGWEIR